MTAAPDDRWVAGDAYEEFMGRWSRQLARQFVEWLRPPPAGNWLDVGCGTGALTSAICEISSPASVVACDPSEAFIAHARATLRDLQVSFVVAGADALPRREDGFDAIVSGLVLNFLPEPEQALAAMRERLRPSGTVAAYVWDYSDGMECLRFFWEEAVAIDGGAATLDERRRFPLCRQEALGIAFRSAGLRHVETCALEIQTGFGTFDEYWKPFLRGTGPAPGYVASLDPDRRAALEAKLRGRVSMRDGGVRLRARAWAVRGDAS